MSRVQHGRSPVQQDRHAEPQVALAPPRLLALQRAVGNRAVAAVVQRQLTRSPTLQSTPFNLATNIVTGRELGITPAIINGNEIPVDAGSAAAIEAALVAPTVATTQSGTQFRARATAPVNTVGAHVKLPQPCPATTVDSPARIAMRLGLAEDKVRHGWIYRSAKVEVLDRRQANTTATIHGEPSDKQFDAEIKAHEMHHADDHWAAAQQILGAWDQKLSNPATVGTGATAAEAEANLHQAAGGTPRQVARQLDAELNRRNDVFHNSDEGRQSGLKGYWIERDGSKVIAHWGY